MAKRTPPRNSKGQFVKRGSTTPRRKARKSTKKRR